MMIFAGFLVVTGVLCPLHNYFKNSHRQALQVVAVLSGGIGHQLRFMKHRICIDARRHGCECLNHLVQHRTTLI